MDFTYKFYRTTQTACDAMYGDLLLARKSIYWEIYTFVDDATGERFINILCEKAKAGIDVKIILDGVGSYGLSDKAIVRLREAGVDLLWFNRLRPEWQMGKWWQKIWRRDHRKVLIIDEAVAFLGGVNISHESFNWNDLYVRLTGKIIRLLLRSFAKSYIYCGGSGDEVRNFLHPRLIDGFGDLRDKISFLFSSPRHNGQTTGNFYHRALSVAKESYNLITPYYVPDKKFLRLITAAKRRGVKVNIFLPQRTDYRFLEWIARGYYGLTHGAGAKLFILRKMHHGKAMTSDSSLGFIGSFNLLPRSFSHNAEAGVFFSDEEMINELKSIFEDLKGEADEFDLDLWKKRSRWSRMKEWVGMRMKYFT